MSEDTACYVVKKGNEFIAIFMTEKEAFAYLKRVKEERE